MPLKDWDAVIGRILEEFRRETTEGGRHKLFARWRRTLEKDPPHLDPQQIDEIVREVRARFEKSRR